jgi:glyoxylase-like metal-dependent hydrolase (beta-lactamase superfamily II)
MAVSDGAFTYTPPAFPPPVTFLFANAPKEHLEPVLSRHNLQLEKWAEWTSPYICLLVNTGKQLLLVDTGAGRLAPTTGQLIPNLQAKGIKSEDIDTVILTHGHPDHIGGNTDPEGKTAFPNARFFMWKEEWEFWHSDLAGLKVDEHTRELLSMLARNNLSPIQSKLHLIDHEIEIAPGIRTIAAPGHTPGHMALSISSEGEQLLCISDTVLHPIHLEQPDWHAAIEFSSQQVLNTRRRLLKQAEAEKALVIAFHFPFPGLGHVIQKGEGWQWLALNP